MNYPFPYRARLVGTHIDFSITLAENQLSVTVADDGVGTGAGSGAPKPGFGLTVAQLMAQQVRGRLEIGSGSGKPGVRLVVTVGMETPAEQA